jgi:hypothetical protein
MAHGTVTEVIAAPAAAVFDLVHDYQRRLEWDTLLSAAYLDDGFTSAGVGATSVCVGRRSLGGLALKTVYVSFDRPRVAAVKLVNRPPFFEKWAASIRHTELGPAQSSITYTFQFTARPAVTRALVEPVMLRLFTLETRRRLSALQAHFASHPVSPPVAGS